MKLQLTSKKPTLEQDVCVLLNVSILLTNENLQNPHEFQKILEFLKNGFSTFSGNPENFFDSKNFKNFLERRIA